MQDIIKKIMSRVDLTSEEATRAMTSIMTGEAGEIRTAAFLTALSMKGATGLEVESFARSMRHAALAWPDTKEMEICDTCGTGGDASRTINISTLSALTLAMMGYKVAKHGNRAVSSSTGSADFLEAAGIPMEISSEEALSSLEHIGITFLFAPRWHPAMKHAMPVRKALGVRTVFNLLGPLTNPAPISYQVIGVYDSALLPIFGSALAGLGRKAAAVVHSDDGLDEVSIAADTEIVRVIDGKILEREILTVADFGFNSAPLSALQVDSRDEAIERSLALLAGKGSDAETATVAMNAALVHSLASGGRAEKGQLRQAASDCYDGLRSGEGEKLLKRWSEFRFGSSSVMSLGRDGN